MPKLSPKAQSLSAAIGSAVRYHGIDSREVRLARIAAQRQKAEDERAKLLELMAETESE